ncbi:MAG: alpha-galactosidase [Opitutaceae bacterium]|nr:alpha-galactosidase [Opitutaceae bacterium]
MNIAKMALALAVVLCSLVAASADTVKKHYVAPTPPMGWNSWNRFGENVSERLIMETADAMASNGMKDAGYQYVVIDDGWQLGMTPARGWEWQGTAFKAGRDTNNVLMVDPVKFPNGMKYVADYVHSKGLRFGIYTAPGRRTCAGHTGSLGYEEIDLRTFAAWGVDYIKLDSCGAEESPHVILSRWRAIIDMLNRPMVLSVNLGVSDINPRLADMWRTTTDIMPIWSYRLEDFRLMASISDIINLQAGLEYLNGPGGWNDPDMLQVGNGNLTDDENRAHISMWAIFGSPLMAGTDLRNLPENIRQIFTQNEIIAIDQDAAGRMGRKVQEDQPGLQVWAKPLAQYGAVAVALLNKTDTAADIRLNLRDIGVCGEAYVRDVWQRQDRGLFKDSFTAKVPPHGVSVLKINTFEHLGQFAPIPIIPAEGVVMEAESLEYYFGGGAIAAEFRGFTGTGYVRGRNHEWRPLELIWVTPFAAPGLYKLEIRYANGTGTTLKYTLSSLSGLESTIDLPSTKNWSDWQTVFIEERLNEGVNHIMLIATNARKMNDVAIDSLKLTPVGGQQTIFHRQEPNHDQP